MAPFDPDAVLARDFHLIKNGPVALCHQFDEIVEWLAGHGYQIVSLDARSWATQADFHRDIKAALDFPGYYGGNLDAFNDCMSDVAMSENSATGLVLAFTGYDAFAGREPRAAQIILDIIADAARWGMLFAHRMLCLVQSNDPNITFDPVGATAVMWLDR